MLSDNPNSEGVNFLAGNVTITPLDGNYTAGLAPTLTIAEILGLEFGDPTDFDETPTGIGSSLPGAPGAEADAAIAAASTSVGTAADPVNDDLMNGEALDRILVGSRMVAGDTFARVYSSGEFAEAERLVGDRPSQLASAPTFDFDFPPGSVLPREYFDLSSSEMAAAFGGSESLFAGASSPEAIFGYTLIG